MEKTRHNMPAASLGTRFSTWLKPTGLSAPILAFFALLAIVPLVIRDDYILRLLVISLLFGAQAMAFNFTTGYINIINFGFAGFFGLGAYTSALLVIELGVSPGLGFVGGAVAAGILGFLTGILTLRLRGIYAACMAWFVQIALMGLATVNVDLTRGALGLVVPPLGDTIHTAPYFYILLLMSIGIYVALTLIVNSNMGLAFRAIGQNLLAARTSGINPTRYKVINWTIACAVAGLLGSFYAHFIGILTPDLMHFRHTVEVLAIAYIGGRGTLWGGLIAAFLMTPVFEYLKPLMEMRLIIYGFLLVLVMMFYPRGLAGALPRLGEWIKQRREKRSTEKSRDQQG
jgi:branched-chain amino acid transport system permease protein